MTIFRPVRLDAAYYIIFSSLRVRPSRIPRRRPAKLRYCFGDNHPTRRMRRVRPPILRPLSCEGGGGPCEKPRQNARAKPQRPRLRARERRRCWLWFSCRVLYQNFSALCSGYLSPCAQYASAMSSSAFAAMESAQHLRMSDRLVMKLPNMTMP